MSMESLVENEMKRIGRRAFPEIINLSGAAANVAEAATGKGRPKNSEIAGK
jgi:hypothetical protein